MENHDNKKDLQLILNVEAKISELAMKKNFLGQEYIKKYCPFKLGDKVIVETESGTERGIIFKLDFDSHSNIKGLARIGISPINKSGLRIISRNGVFYSDVISVTKIN